MTAPVQFPRWLSRSWLLVVLAVGAALRLPGTWAPFGAEISGWTGGLYGQIAHNCLALGRPVLFLNPLPVLAEGVSYAHHPPLVPWASALSMWVFGDSEAAARLPFLLFSLASIVCMERLVRRSAGPEAGLLAAAMLATCPLAVCYGNQVEVVGSLLLLAVLGATDAHLAHLRRPTAGHAVQLAIWMVVLLLADWPGVGLWLLLCGHRFVAGRRRGALSWALAGACVVAATVAWLVSIAPENGLELLERKLFQRTVRLVSDDGRAFGLTDAALRMATLHARGFGPILVGGALGWVFVAARRRLRTQAAGPVLLVAFCLGFAGLGIQGHRQHDFWSHPLAAGYVAAAATALAGAARRRPLLSLLVVAVVGVPMSLAYRDYAARHCSGPARAQAHHLLAGWLRRAVPRGDVVAVVDDTAWPTLTYYAGRRVVLIHSLAELPALRAEPRQDVCSWIRVPAPAAPRWLLVHEGDGVELPAAAVRVESGWRLRRLP